MSSRRLPSLRRAVLLASVIFAGAPPLRAAPAEDPGQDREPVGVTQVDLTQVELGLVGAELAATLSYAVRASAATQLDLVAHATGGPTLALPDHGAVIGAVVEADHGRLALARTPAAEALARVARYAAEPGGRQRRGFALVSADARGAIEVHLGVPGPGVLRVALQVRAPTCVWKEQRWVRVPERWATQQAPRSPARRARDDEAAALAGRCAGQPTGTVLEDGRVWVGLADPRLRTDAPGPAQIHVGVDRLGVDGQRLARVELALGRVLAPMPRAPHVVVLIDASRSLDDLAWASQLELLDGFLAAAPPATQVLLVPYARTARPLVPRWLDAGQARSAVRGALRQLALGNGSEVSVAVAEAGRWLRRVGGERRVLLMSDQHLRTGQRADAAALHQRLPAGARLVAVDLTTGDALVRADHALFAATAAATGGIAMTHGVARGLDAEASARARALPLWRPTSLDHVTIGAAWHELDAPLPLGACAHHRRAPTSGQLDLDEGTGCAWWGATTGAPALRVDGLLWNQPWSRTLTLPRAEAPALARALGPDPGPTDPILTPLRRRGDDLGGHVGPRWALLATWGGDAGYADLGPEDLAWGVRSPTIRERTRVDGVGHGIPRGPELGVLLRAAVAHCLGPGLTLDVRLETTRREIAAVQVRATGRGAAQAAACAEAAIWDTSFEFNGPDHAAPPFTLAAPP